MQNTSTEQNSLSLQLQGRYVVRLLDASVLFGKASGASLVQEDVMMWKERTNELAFGDDCNFSILFVACVSRAAAILAPARQAWLLNVVVAPLVGAVTKACLYPVACT